MFLAVILKKIWDVFWVSRVWLLTKLDILSKQQASSISRTCPPNFMKQNFTKKQQTTLHAAEVTCAGRDLPKSVLPNQATWRDNFDADSESGVIDACWKGRTCWRFGGEGGDFINRQSMTGNVSVQQVVITNITRLLWGLRSGDVRLQNFNSKTPTKREVRTVREYGFALSSGAEDGKLSETTKRVCQGPFDFACWAVKNRSKNRVADLTLNGHR